MKLTWQYEGLEAFLPPTKWEEEVPWMAPTGRKAGPE
jgi:hypothetical protein